MPGEPAQTRYRRKKLIPVFTTTLKKGETNRIDFESVASANSAIPAFGLRSGENRLIDGVRLCDEGLPYASTAVSLWTGNFASCQASNPPITLMTFRKPARCSRLHPIMLR